MDLTNVNLAFAPSLQPMFPGSATATTLSTSIKDSRDLFYALIHISEHYDTLPWIYQYLNRHLEHVNEQCATKFSPHYNADKLEQLIKTADSIHSCECTIAPLNECLLQFAPLFFTELSWLAPISQTVTNQTPLAVDLMAMYLRFIQGEYTIAKSRALYAGHLLTLGIELPALHTFAFASQAGVVKEVFDLAALQLGLAQFPRVFFPEILGFTLSYCQSMSLPELYIPGAEDSKLPEVLRIRNQRRKQELPDISTIIHTYLSEFANQSEDMWQRIQAGFWLHQLQTDYCCQRLSTHFESTLSPRQAMCKLITNLLPHAIGHHGKIQLGSKTIDKWFKEVPFKGENFLATLLLSPLVDRAKPENSKLLKLYEFNGPMFGVLDQSGKAIIRNWLLAELSPGLTQRKKPIQTLIKTKKHSYGLKRIPNEPSRVDGLFELQPQPNPAWIQVDYNKLSNKDLYYYLVNIDLYPEVLPTAKHKVLRVLKWAKLCSRLPIRHYSHQGFESYVKLLYQLEVANYRPLTNKPKLSKEAYIWGIEQFAPTILTDGSWLQGVQQLDYFSSHAIGALLHKIYEDEIGNGILKQNHPYIYQQLLDSLAIKLPPIHSKDFADHPGFIASAFDIPVYLMAISKFPSAFLPELLGLNLAIELSGLGRVYIRLSEELRYWGINSAIVDVHTSIDNLATGHSALAIKAIEFYLDEISACYGEDLVQEHWRRIYTGYCSLESVSKRFKFSLIGQYLLQRPRAHNKK